MSSPALFTFAALAESSSQMNQVFVVIFQLSFPSLSIFLIIVFVIFSLCIVLWYLHRFPHLLIKSCGKFLWFVIYPRLVCLFYSSPEPHSVRASFRPSLTTLALLCNTTYCDTKVQAVQDLFEGRALDTRFRE